MATTTLGQVADTIPTVISKARFTEQFSFPMASLVQNIKKGKGKGSTVNIPYWGTATANTLTEGVDMATSQTMKDTNVQITLNEVGCKIILTDDVIEDNQEDIKSAAGIILGSAMGLKRDTDLLALLDNGTTSIPGTGSPLTMGVIAASRALLAGLAVSSGGPCPGPYSVVLHPYVGLDLVDVLTPIVPTSTYLNTMAGSMTDDVLKNYVLGRLFGMTIIEDGNLTIDSTPDCKGGAFGPLSMILATAREWNVEPR